MTLDEETRAVLERFRESAVEEERDRWMPLYNLIEVKYESEKNTSELILLTQLMQVMPKIDRPLPLSRQTHRSPEESPQTADQLPGSQEAH